MWDRAGRITRWSGQPEAMFGYAAREVLGKTAAETGLLHANDVTVAEDARRRFASGESHVVGNTRRRARSRGAVVCEWYMSAVRDHTRSVLTLGLDVTERDRVAAELHAADRSKNRFLATRAHELRIPSLRCTTPRSCCAPGTRPRASAG